MPNNLRDYAKFLPTKVKYEKLEKKIIRQIEKFSILIDKDINPRRRVDIPYLGPKKNFKIKDVIKLE